MFRNALWRHASKTAVVIGDRAYTYRELDDTELAGSGLAHRLEVDDLGESLPFGEVGEIMARSPYTLASYYNAPDKTAEVYAGQWIKTGDVGYQLDTGHVFIVDRSKDMIISGGMNVYSSEVENVVQEFSGVRQVMVVGIPHQDWGEAVCAAVVPVDEGLDEKALIAFCKEKLAAYKVPKTIEIVEEIPLTAYGKPDKKALRVKYWGDQSRQVN